MALFKNTLTISIKAFFGIRNIAVFSQNTKFMTTGMVVGGLHFSSLWYLKNMSL